MLNFVDIFSDFREYVFHFRECFQKIQSGEQVCRICRPNLRRFPYVFRRKFKKSKNMIHSKNSIPHLIRTSAAPRSLCRSAPPASFDPEKASPFAGCDAKRCCNCQKRTLSSPSSCLKLTFRRFWMILAILMKW